ncbi:SMI1/KNR4 family protein SUKH-1 [Fontibacillus phaseoli]|uniref:SMI1/KNR4 family protein SUKH-1 n=1 Tax=Fontibacillus phaseoli TaxID=1416533 RepID=A0A369BAW0_9BACL|nr:SMI1/KNR4 family protein [Fontibacillus phaseoli]RCX17696.1 SMI1/KNR4 family protein SUKH-1 [Fontibacillus phaseoli]
MDNKYPEIDVILEKMQTVLAALRELDPEFYAKYPMQLGTDAEEQDMRVVSDTWHLPDEYSYFLRHYVPQSVGWSTDEYIHLDIYGAKDLQKGQWGYNYNPVTKEPISDWPDHYLVIASDEGDPYCIDLSEGDTVIYTAEHGTGRWDFEIAYDNLAEFLRSALLPRGDEDVDLGDDVSYDYCKVFITGEGKDKLKTLLFIKKAFSCDVSQARSYLGAVPLLVYKGIETGAANVEAQLKSIGADYEKREIGLAEFLS